jgi:hypothetical protein
VKDFLYEMLALTYAVLIERQKYLVLLSAKQDGFKKKGSFCTVC